MIVCAPCPPSPFILGWAGGGGIGAIRRLCSSVIRMGGRESASQQDSLFYIHQKSCLWFAPSLTCDSMDCSTTMLLRKSCTYHPLFHTTLTPPPFSPFSSSCQPWPPPATRLLKSATVPPTISRSRTLRPAHQLINFFIIIDIAALHKSSDFCQGHLCWRSAPTCFLHLPSRETDRQAENMASSQADSVSSCNKETIDEELKPWIGRDDNDTMLTMTTIPKMRPSLSHFVISALLVVFFTECHWFCYLSAIS